MNQPMRGDQPYTIRITLFSLLLGIPVAVILGGLFYSVNQPVTQSGQQVNFTLSALGFPLALLISGVVLAISVFWLPMRFARRAGRILDPNIYPMMGVLAVAGLLVAAFILGMALKVI